MATTYKVLGQSNPAATTLTTLYTVPAATSAVCSTLAVANLNTSTTFRIAIRPGGAAVANQHYIAYDTPVNQYDTVFLTIGVTLATTDIISVYAETATVSFNLFGSEIA
jgi:hypothetical protein